MEEGPFFPREELYLEIPERAGEGSLDQLCSICELRSTRDSCRYVQYDLLPFSLPFYTKLSTDIQNETKCTTRSRTEAILFKLITSVSECFN